MTKEPSGNPPLGTIAKFTILGAVNGLLLGLGLLVLICSPTARLPGRLGHFYGGHPRNFDGGWRLRRCDRWLYRQPPPAVGVDERPQNNSDRCTKVGRIRQSLPFKIFGPMGGRGPLFPPLTLERILIDHQLHVSAIRTGNSTQFYRGFRPTEKGLANTKLDVPRIVSLNGAGHAIE